MAKKLSLVLAAVAVLAFAVPSMAGASKATLGGVLAPVGTKFTTTGTDLTFKSTLLGNITCATLNLNGVITKNNGEVVEGSGENVSPTQSGCKNGEKAVIITSVNITSLKSSVSGEATFSFILKTDIGTLECTFTGTNVKGTFISGTNVLEFSSASGVTGKPISCGNATLTGQFKLEETASPFTALILD